MPTLVLCLFAFSGIAVGHWVAYELVPAAHIDPVVPHGHVPFLAVAAGMALVVLLVLATVAEAAGRRLPLSTWKLVGIQVAGFAVLEVVERVVAPIPHTGLLGEPVFWVGLLSQIAAALLLRWGLRRLPRALVEALRGPRQVGVPAEARARRAVSRSHVVPSRVALTAAVPRAPPAPVLA